MRIITVFSLMMNLIGLASTAAYSVNETAWQDHQGMISTRLLVASNDIGAAFPTRLQNAEDTILLAWEAKLADGWKTYWRSPGEAGLPVRLFEGEQEQELLYPLPERFELFGLETYGYSKQVVIPFQITAPNANKTLSLKADFMVCKDICVPFQATYDLSIDTDDIGGITSDVRVKNWLARVPEVTGEAPDGLAIQSVKLAGTPGHQNLIVDAVSNAPMTKADVLAEAGETVQFHAPKARLHADGRSARFVLPVISANAARDLAGERVRITLSDGRGNAIDRFFDLNGR